MWFSVWKKVMAWQCRICAFTANFKACELKLYYVCWNMYEKCTPIVLSSTHLETNNYCIYRYSMSLLKHKKRLWQYVKQRSIYAVVHHMDSCFIKLSSSSFHTCQLCICVKTWREYGDQENSAHCNLRKHMEIDKTLAN